MAKKSPFSCICHPKALLLHQNILNQLWNINLVLAVVLRLFVSTRIPLSANVQAWNSHPLLVHIWQRNTPTNASAASACWSLLFKQCLFIIPNVIRVFPASNLSPHSLIDSLGSPGENRPIFGQNSIFHISCLDCETLLATCLYVF